MLNEELVAALAQELGCLLSSLGQRLAVAESCTGGWVCQALTDVPGSSAWFERGWVTYSNLAKQQDLGVPVQVLEEFGAVSAETVRAMVAGALRRSPADAALAVSGIAGPAGAVPGKPVGTVWFAWQLRDGDCIVSSEQFDGDRREVRLQAVVAALRGVSALYGVA